MEAIEVKVVQPTFIGPTGPFSVEEVDAVRAFLFKSVRDVAWKVGLYGRQGAANWDEVTAKLRETITAIFFSVENRIAGLHNKEEKALEKCADAVPKSCFVSFCSAPTLQD